MRAYNVFKVQTVALSAVFCLLAACGRTTDNAKNRPAPENKLSHLDDSFFLDGASRGAVLLSLYRSEREQVLYAAVRAGKTSPNEQPPVQYIKLCTITSPIDIKNVEDLLKALDGRGTSLILGEALQDKLANANSSYLITSTLPMGVNIPALSAEKKTELIASAMVISWPGEGGTRSCQYNSVLPRPRVKVPSPAARASGRIVKPMTQDPDKSDWFGVNN